MTHRVNLDFEAYSEAGCLFDVARCRWVSVAGPGKKKGLPAIGAEAYAMHPSTEVLCAAWKIDGGPTEWWRPDTAPPIELLDAVRGGALVFAFNSMFEWLIWEHVCRRRYGWPELRLEQTRDTAASARACGYPGQLGRAAKAMRLDLQKLDEGKRLIQFFGVPRSPTLTDRRLRRTLAEHPTEAGELLQYNARDVDVEADMLSRLPPLSPDELAVWQADQAINARGVAIDVEAVELIQGYIEQTQANLTAELVRVTDGAVSGAGEVARILEFCAACGAPLPNLQKATVAKALDDPGISPCARRVLETRQALGMASVKKYKALLSRVCPDGRARGLLMYCGAIQTGRWAGRGVQPQNLPRGDAKPAKCTGCEAWQGAHRPWCYRCAAPLKPRKWGHEASVAFVAHVKERPALAVLNDRWGDLFAVASSALRSMFVAGPGMELISSDYSAIEAVVLAAVAGEEWRLEVFRTHGKVYEMSAAAITGNTLEFYLDYKATTGEHHPDRQTIGKVAELASGYQGGVGAWKNFGADRFMADEQIEEAKRKWRAASPAIVDFWHAMEAAAIQAVKAPGVPVCVSSIATNAWGKRSRHRTAPGSLVFTFRGGTLRCRLPSGRCLSYHEASVERVVKWGRECDEVWFWGEDSQTKQWVPQSTYGGKLTENAVQAIARDIMAHALPKLEAAGYPVVLSVHDEAVSEVPLGAGSVEQYEAIMGDLPAWARTWPVKASGGWRGREYRKD